MLEERPKFCSFFVFALPRPGISSRDSFALMPFGYTSSALRSLPPEVAPMIQGMLPRRDGMAMGHRYGDPRGQSEYGRVRRLLAARFQLLPPVCLPRGAWRMLTRRPSGAFGLCPLPAFVNHENDSHARPATGETCFPSIPTLPALARRRI